MLNELGIPVTPEYMCEHFVDHSMSYCMDLGTDLVVGPPPPDFASRYRERLKEEFGFQLRTVAGIAAALSQMPLPFCVAASRDHDKMRTALAFTRLPTRFEGTV